MESFHTTQNLSLIILGLGMMVSVHAVADMEITDANCGDPIGFSDQTFFLDGEVVCSGAGTTALEFTGNNNDFFLQGNSLKADTDFPPDTGILITGDGNHVIGPGTVEGFGSALGLDGNILIENASFNHVSELTLNEGAHGVLIAALDGESAQENHIYHNHTRDTIFNGIVVFGDGDNSSADANQIHGNHIQGTTVFSGIVVIADGDNSSADANQIHDNLIQDTADEGIFVNSGGDNSSTDANQIYGNHIQNTATQGITVNSTFNGSADRNQVHDNSIQDTGLEGIGVISTGSGSANGNLVFFNHITRPGGPAIAFPDATGSLTDNTTGGNITTQPQATPVYCDSSGQSNQWLVNAIGLQLVFDTPGPC